MPIGKGQTLGVGAAGQTETYVTLAKIRDIGGPNTKWDSIDATHSTSTSREKLVGFRDNGQFTVGLVHTPAQETAIRGYGGAIKAFLWTMADGGTYSFEGFFVDLGMSSPYEGLMTSNATIEITGDITYVEPS